MLALAVGVTKLPESMTAELSGVVPANTYKNYMDLAMVQLSLLQFVS